MHTLLLNKLNEFRSKYKDGIKLLSQRSHRLTIDKKSLDLVMETQFHDNFELYFNSKGLLKESLHSRRSCNYKINYYYNRHSILYLAVCSITPSNELHSISDFIYDSKGRIEIETVRKYCPRSNLFTLEQHLHSYWNNKEIINIVGHNDDDNEYTVYNTYDLSNRLVETLAICDDEEIIYWYKNEYDRNGEQIKTVYLDNDGNESNSTDYFKFKDGLNSIYFQKSMDSNSMDEFHYITDEKNNWTNRVNIRNGDLKYVCNRKIDYY
jgi:hypothetical protein